LEEKGLPKEGTSFDLEGGLTFSEGGGQSNTFCDSFRQHKSGAWGIPQKGKKRSPKGRGQRKIFRGREKKKKNYG